MGEIDEKIDALERTILEIDAMLSIFCPDDDDFTDESNQADYGEEFAITTPTALERARSITDHPDETMPLFDIPRIDLETIVRSMSGKKSDKSGCVRLRICLPPGYPSISYAEVTVLSTPKNFPRYHRDDLSTKIARRAKELRGSEAMMEIINECRDALEDWEANKSIHPPISEEMLTAQDDCDTANETTITRRCWIWVHHITNSGRLKQIVTEAQTLNLGGFLKGGYPGVVVVEGTSASCDEFVMWIKGNKSRPGGFGRNWGHHVRGESTVDVRQFPELFQELEDDMGKLGALCREFDVEDEFRNFILQHK